MKNAFTEHFGDLESFDVPIEEVLNVISKKHVTIRNVMVKVDSTTLKCYRRYGTVCWLCGIEATHFIIDKQEDQDVYVPKLVATKSKIGKFVDFTKDHIIPLSWGGVDNLTNMRTMCSPCNQSLGRLYLEIHKTLERAAKKHDIDYLLSDMMEIFAPEGAQLIARIERTARLIGEALQDEKLPESDIGPLGGSDVCDECNGSGIYYINSEPQDCVCKEPQE